jgi:HAD superfamily hydrolase (TIGR01459 family)
MNLALPDRPIVIAGLREIAAEFDHVLTDQWGVLHKGRPILPAVRDCLARLRAAGKRVLILSNSGRRADDNVRRLAALGLPRSGYDAMLTSGDVAWTGFRDRAAPPFDRLGRRCLLFTRGPDPFLLDGLDLRPVTSVSEAEFIFLAGIDEARADLESWRPLLAEAARRALPMLCANPDLVMFGADCILPAPGAFARLFESLGGQVHYIGKPHAPIFAAALAALGQPPPARVLVIGDSLDHDILGGNRAGMATALIAAGVHETALAAGNDLADAVRRLAADNLHRPRWVLPTLAW